MARRKHKGRTDYLPIAVRHRLKAFENVMARRKHKGRTGHLPIAVLRHRLKELASLVRQRSRKAKHRRSR
jgi:hypothetical protein